MREKPHLIITTDTSHGIGAALRDYRGYVIPVLLLTASALTLTFEHYRRSRLSDWAAPPSFGGA